MITQSYSDNTFKTSLKLSLLSMLLVTGFIACSDMQSSGITNEDVAEVQHNIPTTASGEQPLYIINGEVMNLQESGNIIARIKPKYIQDITVLKGGEAIKEHGKAAKNGVIKLKLLDKEKAFSDLMPAPPSARKQKKEEDYYIVVEKMPELIGGLASLQQHIKYPPEAKEAGIEGRVIVQFIVNKQGQVENPQIIRGIGGGADEAALEAVNLAKFKPGLQRGEPVRVQYSLPIVFKLSGGNTIHKKSPTSYVEAPKVDGKKLAISTTTGKDQGMISGIVKDADTGNPLPGANIVINDTQIGTSTDSDGRFQLQNLSPGDHVITISYVGYQMSDLYLTVE